MPRLRITIEFEIDCPADVAWESIHSPVAAAELYSPLLTLTPVSDSLPERLQTGDRVDVVMHFGGIIPAGAQQIAIEDVVRSRFPAGSRTMRDHGRPTRGVLTLLRSWNHELTVWPHANLDTDADTAVWHDELTIRGLFAPLLWLALWPMWQWRKWKLPRLAKRWAEATVEH